MMINTEVTCPSQHILAPAENLSLLHRRDSGPNYKTNRYECNACGKTFHTVSSVTQHCPSCKFDLCPKCYSVQQNFSLTCFQGHPLFKVTNLWTFHQRCSYMNNLYTCDFCRICFDASKTPAAHCSFCKFNLCTNCVQEQQQFMKPVPRSSQKNPQKNSSQGIKNIQPQGNRAQNQNVRIAGGGDNVHSSRVNNLRRYGNRSEIPVSNTDRPTIIDERPLPGGGQRRWNDLFQQALDAGFVGGLVQEQIEEQEDPIEDVGVIDLRPILLPEQNQRNQNLTRNRVESRFSERQPQPEPRNLNPPRLIPERRPAPVRRPALERQPDPQPKPKPKPVQKGPEEIEESKENVEPNRESDSSNALLCVVCLEAPRSHIYEPCKHLCTCEKCSQFLTKGKKPCPICRKPIKGITKIFIA